MRCLGHVAEARVVRLTTRDGARRAMSGPWHYR